MARSLHTPGPKMRSKTPGRTTSDVFSVQKKSSFAQSVASARADMNAVTEDAKRITARTNSMMEFGA